MSGACKHDWHFVQGLTARLRCTRCGIMTWPKDAEQKVQEIRTDVHSCSYHCDRPECIKAQRDELRERLAQPEQEPMAWVTGWHGGHCVIRTTDPAVVLPIGAALYTTPPQRKPLTDEEIMDNWLKVMRAVGDRNKLPIPEFARAIEAKLKEKNT